MVIFIAWLTQNCRSPQGHHSVVKGIFLSTFCLFMIKSPAQQADSFSIQGNIQGLKEGSTAYLISSKNGLADTVSQTTVHQGRFSFHGEVGELVNWYFVKIKQDTASDAYLRLLLENCRVMITGEAKDWPLATVAGSPTHQEYVAFLQDYEPLTKKADSLAQLAAQALQAGDSLRYRVYNDQQQYAAAAADRQWMLFIDQHPGSLYTPQLILRSELPVQEKQTAYQKLSERAKNGRFGRALLEDIETREALCIGCQAPDFWGISPSGDTVFLHSVTPYGKLTMIDFWASWCVPCRAETPNLRKVYAAFHHKGFNILSVSFDLQEKAWKKAISKDTMPWLHCAQLKGVDQTSSRLYHINGIPSFVLLDSSGKILALDLPGSFIPWATDSLRGAALFKRVSDYLDQ